MRWTILPLLLLTSAAAPAPSADRRDYMLSGFERMRVDGPFRVSVRDGASPRASATGDKRALDAIDVRVNGGTLIVSAGSEGWAAVKGGSESVPEITITAPRLSALQVNGGAMIDVAAMRGARVDIGLNGAGTIDVAAIDAGDVQVALTGTGRMRIAGKAQRGRFRTYGAGTLDASGLSVGDAILFAETSGATALSVRFDAKVTAIGLGTVTISGGGNCSVTGGAPLKCGGRMERR